MGFLLSDKSVSHFLYFGLYMLCCRAACTYHDFTPQMLATVVVLRVGKALRVITFPEFDSSTPRKVRYYGSLNLCVLSRVLSTKNTCASLFCLHGKRYPHGSAKQCSFVSVPRNFLLLCFLNMYLLVISDISATFSICWKSNNRTLWDKKT